MRLTRSGKRVLGSDDGLIPMINVVFLLLVFFMVAGSIKPGEPLDIEPPQSVQTGEQRAVHVVHVAFDSSLALDGRVLTEADLGQALSTVMAQFENKKTDVEEAGATRPVLALRADGRVTFERLREVIAVLGNAGVSDVELLTSWIPGATD